jgi:hypothetical protein
MKKLLITMLLVIVMTIPALSNFVFAQQQPGASAQQPAGAGTQQPAGAGTQQPAGASAQQQAGAGAEQPVGAGVSGFSLSVGYNGAELNYREIDPISGGILDKDTGWLTGATIEARYDGTISDVPFFVRANFDYSTSKSATYTGSYQNGTPLTMVTPETIYKGEFNLGYKLPSVWHCTLAMYVGIGYRDWERGQDVLPDYTEHYTWGYGSVGANFNYRVVDQLLVGFDAALLVPFDAHVKTDIDHLVDTATFPLQTRLGYRFQVPVSFDIIKIKGFKLFTFVTPYYERWNVGQSPWVLLTIGGVPVGYAMEPSSHTDFYGVKAGFGINF